MATSRWSMVCPKLAKSRRDARHFYRLETEGTYSACLPVYLDHEDPLTLHFLHPDTPFHSGSHHKLTFNANPQSRYVSLYVNSPGQQGGRLLLCLQEPIEDVLPVERSESDATGSEDEMTITISPTTGNWRQTDKPGTYYVTVFGVEGSTYVLTGTTSHNALTLRNGESMHEKVLRRHYEYFKIILPAGQDLHIGVTAYGGDPDLYLSCKYNATQNDDGYPSLLAGHYGWRGWSLGNDVVTVKASESCAAKSQDSGQTTIYAAVHGFQDSVFAITALAGNDTVVQLEDGRPVEWIVEQHKYSRFAIYTGGMGSASRPSLNIELTPTNCDVDLYVKYCTDPDLSNCEDATKRVYNQRSVQNEGTETIIVDKETDPDWANAKWVVVGVYGFTAGQFTIAAWTTSPLVLIEGQAVMGNVAKHDYRYFKFHVETPADVTITLTPSAAM